MFRKYRLFILLYGVINWSQNSVVGTVTRLLDIRTNVFSTVLATAVRIFLSCSVQTGPGVHPFFHTVGSGGFLPRGKAVEA